MVMCTHCENSTESYRHLHFSHEAKLRNVCPVRLSPPVSEVHQKPSLGKAHVLVPWRALVKALQLLPLWSHHLSAMSQAG